MTAYSPNMNLPVVQIADTQVQQIAYKGEPVVTFAMVDEIHQRADGTAGRNFRENRDRFDEGRDFIRISADEIRRHKIMEISSKAHGDVVLLTERGYLKLVKPMQDDRAWEVQGEMIDCYFKVKNAEPLDRPIMSTALSREARLQFKQSLWLAKQCKLDGNQAILSANHATRVLTGVDMMGLIGVSRVEAPDDHQDINPSEIGNRLGGFKAVAVNRMLCDHGYQVQFRDYKGRPYYELTDKGRAAGARMKDTKKKHDNGTPVLQLMWSSRIVDALRGDLEGASA